MLTVAQTISQVHQSIDLSIVMLEAPGHQRSEQMPKHYDQKRHPPEHA